MNEIDELLQKLFIGNQKCDTAVAWHVTQLDFRESDVSTAKTEVKLEDLKVLRPSPEACSTMRAPGVLSSAFSLNVSARQGACKRSLFKSIGVSPENQTWLPKQ